MAIPWVGYPQVHEIPGGLRVSRQVSLNLAPWTEVDIRTATWAPASPYCVGAPAGLTAAAAAVSAIIKRASIRLVSGTRLYVAEEANPEPGGGILRYNSADATAPGLIIACAAWARRYQWWWKTDGACVVEVELYFDIPRDMGV